jgi:hypothetical protein
MSNIGLDVHKKTISYCVKKSAAALILVRQSVAEVAYESRQPARGKTPVCNLTRPDAMVA